jgi:tetratricopeptide (TPR) repeat protein
VSTKRNANRRERSAAVSLVTLAVVVSLVTGQGRGAPPPPVQDPALRGRAATGGTRPSQSLPPGLEEVFEEGVRAQKAGDLDTAEKAFLRVLGRGGKAAFVYNNLGIVYQQRRDHLRAITQFREAVRLDPRYEAPHVLMGASLLALGKGPEAARELETAVKLDPREPFARLELAKAYERSGDLEAAVSQFQLLRGIAPQDPEYAYQLGSAYLKLEAACYRKVLELDPHSARAYQLKGEVYRDQGRTEMAIRAFERALELNPSFPGVHLTLAQIYFEQGKLAAARAEIERELVIAPESAAALALRKRLDAAKDSVPPQ